MHSDSTAKEARGPIRDDQMIQKEKLSQFYFSQYKDCAKALKKKNNEGKKTYVERLDRLLGGTEIYFPSGKSSLV